MKKNIKLALISLFSILLFIACGEPEVKEPTQFDINKSICFTATEDNASVQIKAPLWYTKSKSELPNLYYSTDGDIWHKIEFKIDLNASYISEPIKLEKNKSVYFVGTSGYLNFDNTDYVKFVTEGEINVSGDIMGLLDATVTASKGIGSTSSLPTMAFYNLFSSCSIVDASDLDLPDVVSANCYQGMFSNCSDLVQAPELPAEDLEPGCYSGMFLACSSLKAIVFNFIYDPSNPDALTNWKDGVPDSCKFVSENSSFDNSQLSLPNIYTPESYSLAMGNLIFTPSANCTITLERENGTGDDVNLEYVIIPSENNISNDLVWKSVIIGTPMDDITSGNKLIIRTISESDGFSKYISDDIIDYYHFSMTPSVAVSVTGNIMSLIDPSGVRDDVPAYAFYNLFANCNIIKAPELPALKMGESCYQGMFKGCTSLQETPKLPATILATSCYESMFEDCYHLNSIPELKATRMETACYKAMFKGCGTEKIGITLSENYSLPATELAISCYESMFEGCKKLSIPSQEGIVLPAESLKQACYKCMFKDTAVSLKMPTIKATELAISCYESMFEGTNISAIPNFNLNIDKLKDSCYKAMFKNCSQLTTILKLPARELATSCYESMFEGCTKLEKAPSLSHVTTLGNSCCESMYSGCTSLKEVSLPNTNELVSRCYANMFKSCINIKLISIPFTDWKDEKNDDTIPTYNWLSGVSGKMYSASLEKKEDVSHIPGDWTRATIGNPLYFKAEEAGATIALNKNGEANLSLSYKINNGEWQSYTLGTLIKLETVGDSVYFSASQDRAYKPTSKNYLTFTITGNVGAYGSIMYLISSMGINEFELKQYEFYKLFSNCKTLTHAPDLPATNLAMYCYQEMFNNCSLLTSAPDLPSTNLQNSCYKSMFAWCTSLYKPARFAKDLTLASTSCVSMYEGCSSIKLYAQDNDNGNRESYIISVKTDKNGALKNMFKGTAGLHNKDSEAPSINTTYYIDNFK